MPMGNLLNSLQNILSNKQLRGAFGEVQLENLVKDALPQNAYKFQFTLTSNSRVDCIVKMPDPPGSICIDSKFPLEDYKKLISSHTKTGFQQFLNKFILNSIFIWKSRALDVALLLLRA